VAVVAVIRRSHGNSTDARPGSNASVRSDMRTTHTRQLTPFVLLLVALLSFGLAACGSDDSDAAPSGSDQAGQAEQGAWSAERLATNQSDPVHPIVINSQLGAGPSRIAFALFDAEGRLIKRAEPVTVRLYTLDGDDGTMVAEHTLRMVDLPNIADPATGGDGGASAPPSHLIHDDAFATVYIVNTELTAGTWGADISATVDGKVHDGLRLRFTVLEATSEPGIGETAPASRQTVLADVDDVAAIDSSAVPIPEMHQLTVAEAIATGKPVVVAFATPAFCQTRFCGPVMESVVAPLWRELGDRVEFVHIEPYDLHEARNNGKLAPVPALAEWGLMTEPWVFVLDGEGKVAAKFEGITDASEVRDALEPLLQASKQAAPATPGRSY